MVGVKVADRAMERIVGSAVLRRDTAIRAKTRTVRW